MVDKLNADVLAIDTLRREYKMQLDRAENEEQHLADLRGRVERVEANIRTCYERAESYRATIERLEDSAKGVSVSGAALCADSLKAAIERLGGKPVVQDGGKL